VVGMGDHVPAFIMQEFPVIKSSPSDSSGDSEDNDSDEDAA